MTRLLSFFFSGLLLVGATNCEDAEPKPEAKLEGTWMAQWTTYYHYYKWGVFAGSSSAYYGGTFQKTFITADSISTYSYPSSVPVLLSAGTYKRQGDTLFTSYGMPIQIEKLTADTLILFTRGEEKDYPQPGIGRIDSKTHLLRYTY